MLSLSLGVLPWRPRGALGPELVVNGSGAAMTGWIDGSTAPATVALVPGGFLLTASGGQTARLRQEIPVEIGTLYQISLTRLGGTASGRADIGTTNGGSQYITGIDILDGETIRRIVTATSSALWINLYRATSGSWIAGLISVRAIYG